MSGFLNVLVSLFKQLLIALSILDIIWILIPITTKKTIKNDKPLFVKVALLVIFIVGVVCIKLLT